MRILIATSHRNLVGGAEKYLQQILPCLAERGHQLALLYEYRFDPQRERIDPLDLVISSLGIQETGVDAGLRFVRDWKPEVVYSQGLDDARLQSALLNEHKTVFYAHNYVGTCASGEKCHAFPSPQPCDRKFGAMCLALYYPRRCGGLNPATIWKMYQRSSERNAQLPRYAAVLVASDHMRREYERHGVSPEKIHLTPLPNPHEGAELAWSAKAASRSRLLFMGRLTKLKGTGRLLEAIPLAQKRLGRTLQLTIAGDGPERQGLEELARRREVQAQFTGWVGGRQKLDLIQQADLLAVPSLWPEPFGLVGIEAGAYGIPAVAFDVGGISDWLIPGLSGELAPGNPPTSEGLAEAITSALSEPSHYAGLCRGAREIAARFALAAHISRLENTLKSVAGIADPMPAAVGRGDENTHAEA